MSKNAEDYKSLYKNLKSAYEKDSTDKKTKFEEYYQKLDDKAKKDIWNRDGLIYWPTLSPYVLFARMYQDGNVDLARMFYEEGKKPEYNVNLLYDEYRREVNTDALTYALIYDEDKFKDYIDDLKKISAKLENPDFDLSINFDIVNKEILELLLANFKINEYRPSPTSERQIKIKDKIIAILKDLDAKNNSDVNEILIDFMTRENGAILENLIENADKENVEWFYKILDKHKIYIDNAEIISMAAIAFKSGNAELIDFMMLMANKKYRISESDIFNEIMQYHIVDYIKDENLNKLQNILNSNYFNKLDKSDLIMKTKIYNSKEKSQKKCGILWEAYKTKNAGIVNCIESFIKDEIKVDARTLVCGYALEMADNSLDLLTFMFENLGNDVGALLLNSNYHVFQIACNYKKLDCVKFIFNNIKDCQPDIMKLLNNKAIIENIFQVGNLDIIKWYLDEALDEALENSADKKAEKQKALKEMLTAESVAKALYYGHHDAFIYLLSRLDDIFKDDQVYKNTYITKLFETIYAFDDYNNIDLRSLKLLKQIDNSFDYEKLQYSNKLWIEKAEKINTELGIDVTEFLVDLKRTIDYKSKPAANVIFQPSQTHEIIDFVGEFIGSYAETIKLLTTTQVPLSFYNVLDFVHYSTIEGMPQLAKDWNKISKGVVVLPKEILSIISEYAFGVNSVQFKELIDSAKKESLKFDLNILSGILIKCKQNLSLYNVDIYIKDPLKALGNYSYPKELEFLINATYQFHHSIDEILNAEYECKIGKDVIEGNILTKLLLDDDLGTLKLLIKFLSNNTEYKPTLSKLLKKDLVYIQNADVSTNFIKELWNKGGSDVIDIVKLIKSTRIAINIPTEIFSCVHSLATFKYLIDEKQMNPNNQMDDILKAMVDNERADAAIIDYLEQNHKSSLDLSKLHNSKSPAVKDKVADMVAKAEEAKRKAEEAERQLQEIERLAREQEETKRREEEIRRDEIERIRKQQEEIRRAGRERRQQIVDVVFHRHEPQLSPEMQRLYDESERRSQESEAIERSGELRVAQIEASLAHFEQNNNERLAQELVALRNPAANPTANPPAPPAPADPANQPHVDTVKFRGFGSKGKKLKDNPAKRDVVKHFFKEYQAVIWTVGLVLGCAFAGIAAFMGAAGLVIGGAMGAGVAVTRFVGGIKAASKAGRLNFGEVMKSIGDMVFLGHNLGVDKDTENKLKNADITIEKAKDRKGWRAKATSKQKNGRNV